MSTTLEYPPLPAALRFWWLDEAIDPLPADARQVDSRGPGNHRPHGGRAP